jgi:hypothetical protein
LEHEKDFSAGFKNSYTFEIPFPSDQNQNTNDSSNNEMINNVVK